MQFQDRIKELRKQNNLSQSELGKLSGVHVTNISRYERGENMPTADVLARLAVALKTTGDYLLSGTMNQQAIDQISDVGLLSLFKRTESLDDRKKAIVKEFLECFLITNEIREKLKIKE
jgi:transcriptional regulator with XRE-family HTH domain